MPRTTELFSLAVLSLAACAALDVPEPDDALVAAVPELRSRCVVATPDDVVAIAASAAGLAIAVADGDDTVVVHRGHGVDCALAWDDAPIAAAGLLDLDDDGAVYVFPAEARDPDAVSTMLAEFISTHDGTVARVDPEDGVDAVVSAGRGIWSFGVSPAGDTAWVTACGPTGIFAIDEADLRPTIPPPKTLWQQQPSVLTDADTFWSVGAGSCGVAAPSPGCGFALVRTTSAGSAEVGTTILDVGAGFEAARLARCGASVCGVLSRAIVRWDDDGRTARTITADELAARSTERVLQVAGSGDGVYALLGDDAGTRVVFVPDDATE